MRFSLISASNTLRMAGECARSLSPVRSRMTPFCAGRAAICTVLFSFGYFPRLRRSQIFHHSQLVLSVPAAEFHLVHAGLDEMQSQATGTHFVKRPALHLARLQGRTGILQNNFHSRRAAIPRGAVQPAAGYFDGPA